MPQWDAVNEFNCSDTVVFVRQEFGRAMHSCAVIHILLFDEVLHKSLNTSPMSDELDQIGPPSNFKTRFRKGHQIKSQGLLLFHWQQCLFTSMSKFILFFFAYILFFWAFNTDFLIFFPLMDVRGSFDLESTYAWRMIFSAQLAVSDDWGVKIGTAFYY